MSTALLVVIVLVSAAVIVALSIWLSRRSPAALSEEDSPLHPPTVDGVGRPAGPDAEAMGVLDRGEVVTGPPPPDGVPTDAPPPQPVRRRRHRDHDRDQARDRAPSHLRSQRASGEPAPSDLAVALRGLDRGYHELFDRLDEHESPDDLARRRVADGWSVIDHIIAAARALAAADRALETTLTADTPTVRLSALDSRARPDPTIATGSVDESLAELGRHAEAAADRVDGVPAENWSRVAIVDDGSGATITALDIARAGVEAGVGHLRAAGDVLTAVRGGPIRPD